MLGLFSLCGHVRSRGSSSTNYSSGGGGGGIRGDNTTVTSRLILLCSGGLHEEIMGILGLCRHGDRCLEEGSAAAAAAAEEEDSPQVQVQSHEWNIHNICMHNCIVVRGDLTKCISSSLKNLLFYLFFLHPVSCGLGPFFGLRSIHVSRLRRNTSLPDVLFRHFRCLVSFARARSHPGSPLDASIPFLGNTLIGFLFAPASSSMLCLGSIQFNALHWFPNPRACAS